MRFFYSITIGATNQINKFLAIKKYVRIRIKEKSFVFSWFFIEIMLLFSAFIFIYGIGKFGLVIDVFLGIFASVTIYLIVAFIGLLIRDSQPDKKSRFKSQDHYFNKYISIESKQNKKYNQEKDLIESTIFKNSKLDLMVFHILDDNNILNTKSKKWNGLGENYGVTGSQFITLVIVLKENEFLLSGVSDKVIINYFQIKINNITLPTKQRISQVREKIFTDNELNSDLKYHDTYVKFHKLISAKIES